MSVLDQLPEAAQVLRRAADIRLNRSAEQRSVATQAEEDGIGNMMNSRGFGNSGAYHGEVQKIRFKRYKDNYAEYVKEFVPLVFKYKRGLVDAFRQECIDTFKFEDANYSIEENRMEYAAYVRQEFTSVLTSEEAKVVTTQEAASAENWKDSEKRFKDGCWEAAKWVVVFLLGILAQKYGLSKLF